MALKKVVFFGETSDREIASVTFDPTHRVYVYDTFLESDSSAEVVRP